MLKFSRKADYALILVCELASEAGEYRSIRDISIRTQMPYKFLSQIATQLKKNGLIESKEGISGGYRLAQKPDQISVNTVVSVIDGPISPVACLKGKDCHCRGSCRHQGVMQELSLLISRTLSTITLADLVR